MHNYVKISPKDQSRFNKAMQGGTIYFIGIGGIGMSALAKYFFAKGCTISGYDKTKTALTSVLETMGITIHYNEDMNHFPKEVDIIIYTPAIPKDHPAMEYYKAHAFTMLKRSQVLGLITMDSTNICVAGTHGKTTVSTMISHLLEDTRYGCNAFLGGISVNYNTNFISSSNNLCVIEADEYDRSFLQLSPSMAVITSMDADHLDIYGTAAAMEEAFFQFAGQIQPYGVLLAKYGLNGFGSVQNINILTYHLSNTNANAFAKNIKVQNGSYLFDVVIKDKVIENVLLNVGGLHNVENVIAAITIANELEIDLDKVKVAVGKYKGVKRRFEYIIAPKNNTEIVMVDDYAHHPTELDALLTGTASLFQNRKIILVFQPHLYSRTRDFAPAFAESLSKADQVILLPIYPARELPLEGVNSEMLLDKISIEDKMVMTKEVFLDWVSKDLSKDKENKVLLMAGAGDIDLLLSPVKELLEK